MAEFKLPPQVPNRVELLHLVNGFEGHKADEFIDRGASDEEFWGDEVDKLLDSLPPTTRRQFVGGFVAEKLITKLVNGAPRVQIGIGLIEGLLLLRDQGFFDQLSPEATVTPSAMMDDLRASVPEHISVLKAQLKRGCPEYFDAIQHFLQHTGPATDQFAIWTGAIDAYRIVNQQIAIQNDQA